MSSGNAHVTLLRTKRLVEDFQKERGIGNFSEALRYIIEDYFKIRRKLDEARSADFAKVCDLLSGSAKGTLNSALIEDLDSLKQDAAEIKNMLILVSGLNEEWRTAFKKYFPKYFKPAPG